jgi:hypothetical protein
MGFIYNFHTAYGVSGYLTRFEGSIVELIWSSNQLMDLGIRRQDH